MKQQWEIDIERLQAKVRDLAIEMAPRNTADRIRDEIIHALATTGGALIERPFGFPLVAPLSGSISPQQGRF